MNKDSVQSQGGVGSEALREAKNSLCVDGHLNVALDAILACNEPDGVMAFLTDLAHIACDRGWRSALKQASDPTPARLIEILRHERDEARARLERSIQILSGIHALLYPPHVKTPDGRVWAFKSPIVEEQMQALSDRIRAIPDESPAPPPAASAPEQEAPLTDEQIDALIRVYWDALKASTSGYPERDAIRAVALAASPAHPITPGLLPSGAGIEPSVHPAVTSSDHRAPDACDTTGASHLPRSEQ